MKRHRILYCLSMLSILFLKNPVHASHQHQHGTPVPQDVVELSGQYPRSKTYTSTINPLDQIYYQFMLTPQGEVIYKKGETPWKYYGDLGYALSNVSEQSSSVGPFDMIAADGNRLIAKQAGRNTLYFSIILKGNYSLSKGNGSDNGVNGPYREDAPDVHYNFFLTSAPEDLDSVSDTEMDTAADLFAKDAGFDKPGPDLLKLLFPVSVKKANSILKYNYHAGQRISPLIPNAWPVCAKPFQWYRIKATLPENLTIVNVGVCNIEKITAARAKLDKQYPDWVRQFGGEYYRPYSTSDDIFSSIGQYIMTRNNYLTKFHEKTFGPFLDSTVNYYLLTRDPGKNYQVWNIDEQFFFCSEWMDVLFGLYSSLKKQDGIDPHEWHSDWTYKSSKAVNVVMELFLAGNNRKRADSELIRFSLNQECRDISPRWREVGSHEAKDKWFSSALESVENPSEPLNKDARTIYRKFFPGNSGQWFPGAEWIQPQFRFEEEPSMAVSMGNIALSTHDKIYTINWAWGSLDHKWRVRNKPQGSVGTEIKLLSNMRLYVPVKRDGHPGFASQSLLPEEYLKSSAWLSYDFYTCQSPTERLPFWPDRGWDFAPLSQDNEISFYNGIHSFGPDSVPIEQRTALLLGNR